MAGVVLGFCIVALGGLIPSRDRAADGFPLFGDGPGGWFGVSARIRYRDGQEETLSRRIELSE
jgi:hypothetical protein